MPLPVADLRGFLAGAWRIERRIADRQRGATGRLTGTALFDPAPGGLNYAEAGTLVFGAYRGEATRRYRFAIGQEGHAAILFDDGRPFHRLDLSIGVADVRHDCPPDIYHGRYRVAGADRWTVTWQVRGPRKHLSVGTRYLRVVALAEAA